MRHLKLISIFLCVPVIGICFLVSPIYGQTKPIELTYSNMLPPIHQHSIVAEEWSKEIEKRTNGRVKITIHHGGTLTPAPQVYDGVVKGLSDIGMSVLAYSRGRFPLTEVMDLPLPPRSSLVATKMVNEYYAKFKPKELDDVKILYLFAHGPARLHTQKPVNKLEDVKGVKIRTFGPVTKIVNALGGVPVAMSMGESYEALSRGVVNGTIAPYETLKNYKLAEVIKFTTEAHGIAYSSPFFVAMNKDKWNALSPDIQKIIEQVNRETLEKHGKRFDEIDELGKDFSLKLGNKVIVLSDEENKRWDKAVQPLYDEYVKKMKGMGLPGEEAVKFVLETISNLQN